MSKFQVGDLVKVKESAICKGGYIGITSKIVSYPDGKTVYHILFDDGAIWCYYEDRLCLAKRVTNARV